MKHLLLLLVGLLLMTGNWGCGKSNEPSFVAVQKIRSPLIEPFESYQSADEVRKLLGERGFSWHVVEDSGSRQGSQSRPPFHIYALEVKGYEHMGFSGDLTLTLFNDRLMAARFYPTQADRYLSTLRKAHQALKEHEQISIEPHTTMMTGADSQNRQYVLWDDSRLQMEMTQWIKRYS